MKIKYKVRGLMPLRTRGGILRCEDCRRVLGYLEEENLKHVYLQLRCHCGESGTLQFGETDAFSATAMAVEQNGALSCPECGRIWFRREDGLRDFAFRFICRCGVCVETSHTPKRKLYQELQFT